MVGHRRVRDREEKAVAGAHAHSAISTGRSALAAARVDDAAEEGLEETAWPRGLCRGPAVLRSAIVLRQLLDDDAALAFAVGVAAFEPFQIAHHAVEIAADLLDLRVERLALL